MEAETCEQDPPRPHGAGGDDRRSPLLVDRGRGAPGGEEMPRRVGCAVSLLDALDPHGWAIGKSRMLSQHFECEVCAIQGLVCVGIIFEVVVRAGAPCSQRFRQRRRMRLPDRGMEERGGPRAMRGCGEEGGGGWREGNVCGPETPTTRVTSS